MVSRVTGHQRTARNIRKLAKTPRAIAKASSRAALKPMLAKAKANLKSNGNYKRGVLHRGMAIRQLKSTSAMVQFAIGATGKARSIAHLIELGVKPHWQPNRGVMHPGHPAFPFLGPAFVSEHMLSIQIFGREVGQAIERQAAMLGAGSR